MRRAVLPGLALLCSVGLGACAATPITGDPAAPVAAVGETAPVGTVNDDAADDPAIWRNASDPAASLVVGTDKKAGLYVYGLDGAIRSFTAAGLINNVDIVDMGDAGVIVVASDRNDPSTAQIQTYRLDTSDGTLASLGATPGGAGEGYGLCAMRDGEAIRAYSVLKNGLIEEYRLSVSTTGVTSEPLLTRRVASQPEGCVLDPRDGTLYVGEEALGIWRFAKDTEQGTLVAPIDNKQLVADVEGLAIAPEGVSGGWLIASSQGDNTYAVYRLPGMEPAGRFAITAGAFGATEETDGIDLVLGDFGTLASEGLFVAQDGINAPAAQNFKYVPWSAIRAALDLGAE